MLSIVKSMSLLGLDGYLISVQVDVSGGLHGDSGNFQEADMQMYDHFAASEQG